MSDTETIAVLDHVDEYLKLAQQYDCSDVHLSPTCQPSWRRYGRLQPVWENADYTRFSRFISTGRRHHYQLGLPPD